MRMRLSILSVAILCFGVAPAMADLFPDTADASQLQGELDALTVSPVLGTSSVNVATDMLPDGSGDSFWSIVNSTTGSATMIIELAGFAATNKFGVYEPGDLTNKVEMFSGDRVPGDKAVMSFITGNYVKVQTFNKDLDLLSTQTSSQPFSGNVFGFYLDSSARASDGGGVFYSDTAENTTDGQDHMYAYQGVGDRLLLPGQTNSSLWTNSGFILAWEDLVGPLGSPYGGATGLSDRNFTDMVVMVESINPVPVPAAVLLGFLGLGAAGLKLRRFA